MKTNKLLIVDLEATCWKGNPPPGQFNEIIEVGYALLNLDTGTIDKNDGIIVKPVKSTVSDFCTELTSITPEMAEKGVTLNEAIQKMKDDIGSLKKYPLASWGNYDVRMLTKHLGRDYPFSDRHVNVKLVWSLVSGHPKEVGMETALAVEKLDLCGTHHRGKDDAYNIARLCLRIFAHNG